MFPLAFDAGWLQGHWWGFISRNYVVWPTFLWMFSLLLKDLISDFYSHQDQLNLSLVTRKPVFGGVRPSKTQTSLLSNRDQREAWNFGFSNYRYYTRNKAANHKIADQFLWMHSLISTLLFTYGINGFSHDVAHLIPKMVTVKKFNPKWHFRGWVQDWESMCYFSAFMICHFSVPSFTLQKNSW